jgi:GTP-binding protein
MDQQALFVKSASHMRQWPHLKDDKGKELPEIAVLGRSNVGKSSLMNHLFGTKRLVRVSSTPGKTQLLNFFVWDRLLSFVDLPGYGYAEAPLEIRKQWGPMIQEYLTKRQNLRLLLFLFDIRRLPGKEDLQLIEWFRYAKKPAVLVLTKVDKVSKAECARQTQKILAEFDAPDLTYIHYSVPKNIGRDALIHMLRKAA